MNLSNENSNIRNIDTESIIEIVDMYEYENDFMRQHCIDKLNRVVMPRTRLKKLHDICREFSMAKKVD